MQLRTGAIYSLSYARWVTNKKIYAFILWPGGGYTKTHLLNISAKQLNILDRTKIIRTIVRISKIPSSNKYNGRILYKIFKTYLPNEIKKCYRTFFTYAITNIALLNYGLNKEEDFSELELANQDKILYEQAQRDFQIKAINMYSGRGYKMEETKKTIAGDNSDLIKDEEGGSNVISGTKPAIRPAIKEDIKKENTPNNDDDDFFGY